jgi:hypothetical protein
MAKRWLAMEIGCLECGNPSNVLGTFDTAPEAWEAFGSRVEGIYLRSEMSDDYMGDWNGSAIGVIFDLGAD